MRLPAPLYVVITTSAKRWYGALRTADTVIAFIPDSRIRIAVVDDRYGHRGSRHDGIAVREVVRQDFGEGEFDRLAALYSADELVDLLRPFVVRHVLLGAGSHPDPLRLPPVVMSVPDDAEFIAPVDAFLSAAGTGTAASIVRATSVPRDGRLPDEVDLAAGGFTDHELFAVTSEGRALLDWWISRSQRHPLVEGSRFATHEIRWLDQAKRMFPHIVTEVPGVTRSYRNADESEPGSAPVLRFPDFDSVEPWNVSPRAGLWPRVTMSTHSDLAAAALRRSNALRDTPPVADVDPYGHVAAGYRYDRVMRSVYSECLHHAERNALPLPPNPFSEPAEFISWLQGDIGGGVSRYLDTARRVLPDLRRSFDHDDGALLEWARTSGPKRGFSPSLTGVLPSRRKDRAATGTVSDRTVSPPAVTPGINLIGLFKAEMGIGEAARLTHRAVHDSGIAHSLVLDAGTAHRQYDPFELGDARGFRHDVNIVVANADALGSVIARLDQPHGNGSAFRDHRTIGLWFWETATFLDRYHDAFRFVDEVWVASRHVYDAIAPSAARQGVPVQIFPLGASLPLDRIPAQAAEARCVALGIPAQRFCFFFAFDHRSVAERKNPWGLIEAFCLAFPTPSTAGPVLVIKSISGEVDLLGREHLRWLASQREDIRLIEGYVDAETRQALLCRSNAYISLHRAEGFGLTMAESMGLGVPTIATGYSGNLEFMTDDNSWLVDFDLVPIANDVAHYGGTGCWAEPNVEHAAAIMQRIIDEPDERVRRAAQGARDLAAMATGDAGARFIIERMRAIRRIDLRARQSNQRAAIRFPTSKHLSVEENP